MTLPLTLYEYIAVLIPGALLVAAAILKFPSLRLGTGVSPIWYTVAAYVLGQLAQAAGRRVVMGLRNQLCILTDPRIAILDQHGQTHRNPVDELASTDAEHGKRLERGARFLVLVTAPFRFLATVLVPWPREAPLSSWKAHAIRTRITEMYGDKVTDNEIHTVCLTALHGNDAMYRVFSMQADFFRGLLVALPTLGLVAHELHWLGSGRELPSIVLIVYSVLLCAERFHHFEYLAVKVVFEQFLGTHDNTRS